MIFISHSHNADHSFALMLGSRLEADGIKIWLAPESIDSAQDYAAEIPWAIKSCEYFILLLSDESQKSPHVRKEVDLAIKYRKPIIPLRINNSAISEKYEYLLSNVQIKSISNNDDYMELLNRCRFGEREVSMNTSLKPMRQVVIIKGDYQDNMSFYIASHSEALPTTVFAMGIDRSARLDISSTKGIIRSVCEYLLTEYHISTEMLQILVDQAKKEQLGLQTDQQLNYKDSVLITVPIRKSAACSDETIPLQLLLIANSQKKNSYQLTKDVDDVEGIDSREIVIEVFNKCRKLGNRADTLFVGAMGTNGLSFPYEVITAETLNCFAYSQRINISPYNLFYSVRKEDILRADLSIDEIMQYISTVNHFFRD